jgi:hypothetical protein
LIMRIQLMIELIKGNTKTVERAQEFHRQIYNVMKPIFDVMQEGINLLCGDGQRRLCFPRLAAFMGDYEEAWRLSGVVHGHCVNCTVPSFRIHSKEDEFDANVERKRHDARTGEDAIHHRVEFNNQPTRQALQELNRKGYHPVELFTDTIPFPKCSIYDAIAPDLLHQVSKNFHDQIFKKWSSAVVASGTSLAALNAELDARFQHIPAYPGLRWFNNGISHIQRWTGSEYKGMMRIFLGIARGLCDDNLLSMIRRYVDIHRMSHYESHADAELPGSPDGTLQYLDESVKLFFDDLLKPDGILIQSNLIREDFMTNKLHAMVHYTDWIREKGSLPPYSTDRTEGLHPIYKLLWRATNRGHESDKAICLNEWRSVGMLLHNEELRREAVMELKSRGLEEEGSEQIEEEDADTTGRDDDEDERGYDRLYEWEMQLEDEPEFEYLGNEDQTEAQVAARMAKELYEREGRKRKMEKGVRFKGAKLKRFPRELEKAEEDLDLIDKRLVQETLRALCWIKGNRQPGPKPKGAITLLGVETVLVTTVFESIECVYPKITDPKCLVKEVIRCTDKFPLAANSNWIEPRHDTVLVNYDRNDNAEGTMIGRRVARL